MAIIKARDEVLKKVVLCDHCLGRLFSLAYKGNPVEKVGAAVRAAKSDEDVQKNLSKKLEISEDKKCVVCGGVFLKKEKFEKLLFEKSKEFEFSTFLVGSKFDESVTLTEEAMWEIAGAEFAEPIKREINRTFGKWLEEKTKKTVDFDSPDIMFVLDYENGKVDAQVRSSYIYGRYRKLVRGIPQTKWPCRECHGKGCKHCNGKGKMYDESVEEIIAEKLIPMFSAEGSSFHGKGREDIDALMLGTGRPFVIEMVNPRKREIDLAKAEKIVNKNAKGKVEVSGLRFSSKEEIIAIKASEDDKVYECIIKCDGINADDLKLIEKTFKDVKLKQRTPTRVAHRRADKVRDKFIYSVKAELIDGSSFKAVIRASSGTYIKELISSDCTRTKPSFSELINKPCVCESLNVVEVLGE